MKRIIRVLMAVSLVATLAAPALASDASRLAAAQKALAQAVYAKTPEPLIKARAEFEAMSTAKPKAAALHYWIALADWRLVPRLDDKKQGLRYCRDGLEHADKAIAIDAKFSEALAVKASLQGLSLRFDSSNMMTLGQEMEMGMRRASTLDPKNPRVRLLDGISTLHKPAFVGGGPDKALAKFKEAIELFAAESNADSLAPRWGHDDALIWAGRSALQLGDHAAALAYYHQALEVDPSNGWVRGSLIPEAEKAAHAAAAASDSAAGKTPATSGTQKP